MLVWRHHEHRRDFFRGGDPAAILDRHAIRRTTGVPAVSLLVGPIGAGAGTWHRWAASTGRSVVVAKRNLLLYPEWVRSIAEQIDLPVAAVHCLAQRAGRDPDEFLAAWRAKTPADCERFWNALAPNVDDDLLWAVATPAVGQGSQSAVAAALSDLGERIVPVIARLVPSAHWPSVLFVGGSEYDFSSAVRVAVKWAMRVPALSIAIVVPAGVWNEYVATAPELCAKALLREGSSRFPSMIWRLPRRI